MKKIILGKDVTFDEYDMLKKVSTYRKEPNNTSSESKVD